MVLRDEEMGSLHVRPPSSERVMPMLDTVAASAAGPTVNSSTPMEMKMT